MHARTRSSGHLAMHARTRSHAYLWPLAPFPQSYLWLPSLDFRYINQEANRETAMTRMTLHRDRNNRGESLIIALGNYTGGGLWVAGSGEFDIHDKFMKFDGNIPHGPLPSKGERYSIVLYTNSKMETASRDDLEVPCRCGLLVLASQRCASIPSPCYSCLQQARKLGFPLPEPSELAVRDVQSQPQFPLLWDAAAWSDFTALGGRLPPLPELEGDSDSEYSNSDQDGEADEEDDETFLSATEAVSPDAARHSDCFPTNARVVSQLGM